MKKILLLVQLLWSNISFSQNKFLATFPDTATAWLDKIKSSRDGGFLSSGVKLYPMSSYFLKTDSAGNTIFSKSISSDTAVTICDFTETTNGFSLLIRQGYTTSLLKLDSNGSFLSMYSYDLPTYTTLESIHFYGDHYIITGNLYYTDGLVILNCDTTGVVTWCKKIYNQYSWRVRNSVFPNNSNFFITGDIYDPISQDHNLFNMKCDSNGNVLWNKAYDYDCFPVSSSDTTADGGLVVLNSFSGSFYSVVLNIDSNGTIIWQRICSSSTSPIIMRGIKYVPNNGFILAGQTYSSNNDQNVLMMRLNNTGSVLWTKKFTGVAPTSNFGFSICLANDGGYSMAGNSTGFLFSNDNKGFILKTDSLGDLGCFQSDFAVNSNIGMITDRIMNLSDSNLIITGYENNSYNMDDEIGNIICSSTTTIEQQKLKQPYLYPNPVYNKAILSISDQKKYLFSVYNTFGKIVLETTINSSETEIDFSTLANDIYLYQLSCSENNFTGKFIVAH